MVKINNANLKFRSALQPISKNNIKKLVQHHMAHPSWGIQDVHNYHKNSNGWNGIGYNWWIDFNGNIYEGRGFNLGAHVGGHNSYTLGIGYQGDFTKQKMPDAQLKAGIELNKWLIAQLPNVSKNDIIGHKDLASTSCPGQNFRMSELKKGVGGVSASKPTNTKPKPSKPTSTPKTGSVVDYLNAKGINSSFANRKKLASQHGIRNYKGTASQNVALLNKLKGGKPASKPSKSVKQMASEVKKGLHGNGHANRRKSLGVSNAKYQEVRNYINKGGSTSTKKPVSQMAQEIIDGKHGSGHANRRKSLGISNAEYQKVRSLVNKRM